MNTSLRNLGANWQFSRQGFVPRAYYVLYLIPFMQRAIATSCGIIKIVLNSHALDCAFTCLSPPAPWVPPVLSWYILGDEYSQANLKVYFDHWTIIRKFNFHCYPEYFIKLIKHLSNKLRNFMFETVKNFKDFQLIIDVTFRKRNEF